MFSSEAHALLQAPNGVRDSDQKASMIVDNFQVTCSRREAFKTEVMPRP